MSLQCKTQKFFQLFWQKQSSSYQRSTEFWCSFSYNKSRIFSGESDGFVKFYFKEFQSLIQWVLIKKAMIWNKSSGNCWIGLIDIQQLKIRTFGVLSRKHCLVLHTFDVQEWGLFRQTFKKFTVFDIHFQWFMLTKLAVICTDLT